VAQDAPAALDTSSPASEPGAPASFSPPSREPWQLGIGYQYQHYQVLGQTFHNNGFNTDLTRYVTDWFGLEGTVAMGFGGDTGAPLHLNAKSLFVGGGPHIAIYNSSRLEPWGHVLVGLQHFRFTQTGSGLGSNSALGFMAGGGVDFKIGARVYWRIQGDYVGTHFQGATQKNYSFGSGFVFNF
jgi:hypothetical protein